LWTGLATMPIFFWELAFGLWMTFKGFNESAPILAGLREGQRAEATLVAIPTQTPAPMAGQA
jgi:hypothetical protein